MSKMVVFIQVQGRHNIAEVEISTPATVGVIHDAIRTLGIELDDDMVIFIDESERHEHDDHSAEIHNLRHGCRIHLTRCKKIEVRVHFLDKTIHRAFPPGARVRSVKQWAVSELMINPTDAGEHILQLCDSTRQPPTDTRLAELVEACACDTCFDLVPEKRVEG